MLVLRLQRIGRENTPAFRVVVSEKSLSAKKGSHEILGHYLPAQKPPVFECDTERATYWISKGAHPSDTLARLLKKAGMKDMEKFTKKYTKQRSKKAPAPEAAPAPAPAPAAEAPAA
jgi:small subunit ribosomal protein S16